MSTLGLPAWDLGCDSYFADILESVAPDANDLVVLIKSYFDESYDANVLCIAGYSFTSQAARAMDEAWRKMLIRNHRLPYFRMSACNAKQDPFDRLTKDECIEVATEAINLINKYAQMGFAVTVDQNAFDKIVTLRGFVSTAYEFCSWIGLTAANEHARHHSPSGGMSFFFEAGFKHQALANRMMTNLFSNPNLKAYYRYKSHTFMDKKECVPTQAADMLAWQWYKSPSGKKLSHGSRL